MRLLTPAGCTQPQSLLGDQVFDCAKCCCCVPHRFIHWVRCNVEHSPNEDVDFIEAMHAHELKEPPVSTCSPHPMSRSVCLYRDGFVGYSICIIGIINYLPARPSPFKHLHYMYVSVN